MFSECYKNEENVYLSSEDVKTTYCIKYTVLLFLP